MRKKLTVWVVALVMMLGAFGSLPFKADTNVASAAPVQAPVLKDGSYYEDVIRTSKNIGKGLKISANKSYNEIKLEGGVVGYFTFDKNAEYVEITLVRNVIVNIEWSCSKYYASIALDGVGVYLLPQLLQDNGKTQSFNQIWIGDMTRQYMNDAEKQAVIDAAIAEITLPAETITNIFLPTSIGDVTVAWSSNNTAMTDNGVVTRPTYADDATVILTATFSYNGEDTDAVYTVTDTKLYTVKVIAVFSTEFFVELKCFDVGQKILSITVTTNKELPANVTNANFASYFQFRNGTTNIAFTAAGSSVTISADRKTVVLKPATNVAVMNNPSFNVALTAAGNTNLGGVVRISDVFNLEADQWARADARPDGGALYRIYSPDKEKYNQQSSYPLLVLITGAPTAGATDNNENLTAWRCVAFSSPETQDIFGGMYVMVQQTFEDTHSTDKIMATILNAMSENPDIDSDRVYIGGASQGGLFVWGMLLEYPDFFAAAIPMSALISFKNGEIGLNPKDLPFFPGADDFGALGTAASIAHIPIWTIHCVYDQAVCANLSIEAYNGMKAAGAQNMHITLFMSVRSFEGKDLDTHWSNIYVFNNFPTASNFYGGTYLEDYYDGSYIAPKGINFIIDMRGPRRPIQAGAPSEMPTDFGYPTIMHWLADQSK